MLTALLRASLLEAEHQCLVQILSRLTDHLQTTLFNLQKGKNGCKKIFMIFIKECAVHRDFLVLLTCTGLLHFQTVP